MNHKIVMISGRMGSGKTTITDELRRLLTGKGVQVHTVKFADVIYQIHDYALDLLFTLGFYGDEKKEKDRRLLQLLGTEWGRALDKNIWAKLAIKKCHLIIDNNVRTGVPKSVIFIDDCRFENEFDYVSEALRVRLECDEEIRKSRATSWSDGPHPSEYSLDNYSKEGKFDMYFRTDDPVNTPNHVATLILAQLDKGSWHSRRVGN